MRVSYEGMKVRREGGCELGMSEGEKESDCKLEVSEWG